MAVHHRVVFPAGFADYLRRNPDHRAKSGPYRLKTYVGPGPTRGSAMKYGSIKRRSNTGGTIKNMGKTSGHRSFGSFATRKGKWNKGPGGRFIGSRG